MYQITLSIYHIAISTRKPPSVFLQFSFCCDLHSLNWRRILIGPYLVAIFLCIRRDVGFLFVIFLISAGLHLLFRSYFNGNVRYCFFLSILFSSLIAGVLVFVGLLTEVPIRSCWSFLLDMYFQPVFIGT